MDALQSHLDSFQEKMLTRVKEYVKQEYLSEITDNFNYYGELVSHNMKYVLPESKHTGPSLIKDIGKVKTLLNDNKISKVLVGDGYCIITRRLQE